MTCLKKIKWKHYWHYINWTHLTISGQLHTCFHFYFDNLSLAMSSSLRLKASCHHLFFFFYSVPSLTVQNANTSDQKKSVGKTKYIFEILEENCGPVLFFQTIIILLVNTAITFWHYWQTVRKLKSYSVN